jgi:AcrR family transcriptional regulator
MGTEDDILRCARDLYVEHGLAGLSMRAVASCAGVSATAIYRHFAGKEELLGAVCAQGFELFGSYLGRGLRGATARERLDLTGDGYFDFAMEHRPFYVVMFMSPREHLGYEKLGERIQADAAPTFRFLVDRVRECMAEGVLSPGDPEHAAITIWAHCHGLVSLWMTGLDRSFEGPAAFRAFYRASLDRIVLGLSPSSPAAKRR